MGMIIHNDIEQNSDEWLRLRAGVPTASKAKSLVTSLGAPSKSIGDYAQELAADLFAGKPIDHWDGNKYTERGHEVEDEARDWYSLERNIDLEQVGFITNTLPESMGGGKYGCSPDNLAGEDGNVEIKCLPKGHLKALLYWHKNKKPPTEFVAQTQMQMLTAQRKWTDLVYYHRELPKLIIRIERDEKFCTVLKAQIEECLSLRDEVVTTLKQFGEKAA